MRELETQIVGSPMEGAGLESPDWADGLKKICSIIVHHRGRRLLDACIYGLLARDDVDEEVIIATTDDEEVGGIRNRITDLDRRDCLDTRPSLRVAENLPDRLIGFIGAQRVPQVPYSEISGSCRASLGGHF